MQKRKKYPSLILVIGR